MIIVLGGWFHTQDLHPFNFLATILCHAIMLECVCNWGLQIRGFCLESGAWVLFLKTSWQALFTLSFEHMFLMVQLSVRFVRIS